MNADAILRAWLSLIGLAHAVVMASRHIRVMTFVLVFILLWFFVIELTDQVCY
jgi:hypothetical protein